MQLAKSMMEWLIELCDESTDNIYKVLRHFDLTPFFIVMSLWASCQHVQKIEKLAFPWHDGAAQNAVPLNDVRQAGVYTGGRNVADVAFSDACLKTSTTLPYKLQLCVSRFLKLIMTGSLGELPAVPIPVALATPTGFSAVHMTALLTFIQYSAR